MTLNEAIKHAKKIAEEKQKQADGNILTDRSGTKFLYDGEEYRKCCKCAEEHRQLVEWLKDYKRLKEQEQTEDICEKCLYAEETDGSHCYECIKGENNYKEESKMTKEEAIAILENEKKCVNRANKNDYCNRDCYNCELVKTDTEILNALDMAIKALEQNPNLEKICEELSAENDDLRDQLAMRDRFKQEQKSVCDLCRFDYIDGVCGDCPAMTKTEWEK